MLRFQYGFKKVLILNQLFAVTCERIPKAKEAEVPIISMPTTPRTQKRECRCGTRCERARILAIESPYLKTYI